MRTLLIAGAAVAAMTAGDASAQRMVAHGPGAGYPAPGMTQTYATPGYPAHGREGRWGSDVNGHWWGGMNAPGGWNAYRRPHRGSRLSPYWVSPRFAIADWQDYGLSEPPYGYGWSRYYDDAVLIDGQGSVYDTMGGIDWNGGYGGGYAGDDTVYAGGAGYAPPPSPPPAYGYDGHRSSGIGGAVAGAAVGGVAGNLIAGRGNRLAGTLIGAGVGGVAGYAIDRGTSGPRGARYGAGYGEPPYAPGYAPPPPPPPPPPPHPAGWVSPDGGTFVTTTTSGGYGGTTTTVVVQTAPVVTTTTTEIYEDAVTYSPRPRVWHRKVWHKPVWHRPACGCR